MSARSILVAFALGGWLAASFPPGISDITGVAQPQPTGAQHELEDRDQ